MLEMILTETVKSTFKDAAKKQTGEIGLDFIFFAGKTPVIASEDVSSRRRLPRLV
jgi:hypothetical protein